MTKKNTTDGTLKSFETTRAVSLKIVAPFHSEELLVQPFEWVSPCKWHLGHTTWFFDQMVLSLSNKDHKVDPKINFAFNSYYEAFGQRTPRDKRSNLTSPTLVQVMDYRKSIENKVSTLLCSGASPEVERLINLGIHHEKQHQELMLQDLKSVRSLQQEPQPIEGTYSFTAMDQKPLDVSEGLYEIGAPSEGFSYDNESPKHKVYLYESKISGALVTNGEYLEFINAGGYENYSHWLSDGWAWLHQTGNYSPLYWRKQRESKHKDWQEFCLWKGWHPLELDRPVSHINYYEATAYAKWKAARLPLEAELELLNNQTSSVPIEIAQPPAMSQTKSRHDQLWQWTSSDFAAYPRYKPANDATMEYNSKFMCSQKVLRGGSYATPIDHYRPSYRNFYYPHERWMHCGIRLAYDG